MIELITSYSLSKVPIITYDALDAYAEAVVRDASPDAFISPRPIDAAWFIEFYLGLDVAYKRLSYDRMVLGMTAFERGYVKIIDEETGLPDYVFVDEGTVIIEPELTLQPNGARLRFTYMHEGSHWLIHRRAFSEDNPFGIVGKYENHSLATKEGRKDYSGSKKENTDIERMERQADFLASAILMPKSTLRMAYSDYFAFYCDKPRKLIRGVNAQDDLYARQLPEYLQEFSKYQNRWR